MYAIVSWLVKTKLELTCKYVSKVFIELTRKEVVWPTATFSSVSTCLDSQKVQFGKSYLNICDIKTRINRIQDY